MVFRLARHHQRFKGYGNGCVLWHCFLVLLIPCRLAVYLVRLVWY